jgi:hypothetical protein
VHSLSCALTELLTHCLFALTGLHTHWVLHSLGCILTEYLTCLSVPYMSVVYHALIERFLCSNCCRRVFTLQPVQHRRGQVSSLAAFAAAHPYSSGVRVTRMDGCSDCHHLVCCLQDSACSCKQIGLQKMIFRSEYCFFLFVCLLQQTVWSRDAALCMCASDVPLGLGISESQSLTSGRHCNSIHCSERMLNLCTIC